MSFDSATKGTSSGGKDGSRDRLTELWLLVFVIALPMLALAMIGKAVRTPSEDLLDHVNSWHLGIASGLRDRVAYAIVLLLAIAALGLTLAKSSPLAGRLSVSVPSGRWWRILPVAGAVVGLTTALLPRD